MSAIEEMGSPFEEDSTDLLVLDSKEIIDDMVFKVVREVVSIGQYHYVQSLCHVNIQGKTKPLISEAIKKNKLPPFKQQPQKNLTKKSF